MSLFTNPSVAQFAFEPAAGELFQLFLQYIIREGDLMAYERVDVLLALADYCECFQSSAAVAAATEVLQQLAQR